MSSDRSVAIKGSFWTAVSTAVTMIATFVRVMILTRFLEKSDFGLVSIINMVIGLCTTFTDLGFASVIMCKQKLSIREFSSLYWLQFILFAIIYALLFAISPFISSFYDEPMLCVLIPIASLTIIFQAIGKLYDSVLQKQYQFKSLAFRGIVSNFASLIVAIVLAYFNYGVYSLVLSTLFQILIFNAWNITSGYKIQRVSFVFSYKEVLPLLKIGVFQTGTRILDFISSKLDVMIIGKFLGTEALGVYDLAKELVFRFVDFIRTVVSKVALPILSNNNTDDESVKRKFLMLTRVVASLCIPICITVAVFSESIVYVVYGADYVDTAPIVSIFAIVTMFTSILSFFDMLGVAKGRTDLNFYNTVARILVTIPIIAIASTVSVLAVSLGQLLATILMAGLFWQIVVKHTYPIRLSIYLRQFSRLLVCSLSIGIIVYILNASNFFGAVCHNGYNLLLCIISYLSGAVIMYCLFLKEDVKFMFQLIKRK